MEKFITILAQDSVALAHIARTRLESEGIPCRIANEHIIGVHWLYANAVGGVQVQVPESQAAEALALLSTGAEADTPAPSAAFPYEKTADGGDDYNDGQNGNAGKVPSRPTPSAGLIPDTSIHGYADKPTRRQDSPYTLQIRPEGNNARPDVAVSDIICPRCASDDIAVISPNRLFMLAGLPVKLSLRLCRCRLCRHWWKA